ncbi:aromatic aminobenezylarsenical efflux permease ArsG family transporter [bacterium]|nr:aromatic aminobenezylarsenical efflux permease ArsG family transporter [bacterium]
MITVALTVLWLGILTSISPCPLATNIAAISYLGKRTGAIRNVILGGIAYTSGRMLTYVVIAFAVVETLFSISAVSMFLQTSMNKILGPVLIVTGMFLLELLTLNIPGFAMTGTLQRRVDSGGIWGAGFLGILFALSFCPVSAALFFGSLIPLSLQARTRIQSGILYPSLYGIGTALPVIICAFFIAFGMNSLGRMFTFLTRFERWSRRITGIVFIVVGIYYSIRYIF